MNEVGGGGVRVGVCEDGFGEGERARSRPHTSKQKLMNA